MRDIWLAFIETATPSSEVKELKQQVRDQKALLYETIENNNDFRSKLADRLRGWAVQTKKEPRSIQLVPRSNRDILGADRFRRRGEKLIDLGSTELGHEAFRQAIAIGGPPEKIAYGRVLARQGRIHDARALAKEAISDLTSSGADLNTPSVAEALAFEAYLLHREKNYFEGKLRREQALGLLQRNDDYTRRVRCRILDDLGLSHQKLGEFAEAAQRFEEALTIRAGAGDQPGVAQSHVNLARNAIALGQIEDAESHARKALAGIGPLPPSSLHANVYLLHAQLLIRQGRPSDAIEWAKRSAVLNGQLGNEYGSAMAENVLSQALRRVGELEESRMHARRSVEINAEMGVADPPEVLSALVVQSGQHVSDV